MNNTCNKNVYISGKTVITDWRKTRIISPENFQGRIEVNENAKNEISKQRSVQVNNNLATRAL